MFLRVLFFFLFSFITFFISSQDVILKDKKYVLQSVLADVSSQWYKISIYKDGFYKITYEDLISYGISKDLLKPNSIHLYGNATGMLPEENNVLVSDDLIQNAVSYFGLKDGSFDPGDYILFYGFGPDKWVYSNGFFQRKLNIYSNESY